MILSYSSYETIVRSIGAVLRERIQKGQTSQEEIAHYLNQVRYIFAIDENSFSFLMAGLAYYKPAQFNLSDPDLMQNLSCAMKQTMESEQKRSEFRVESPNSLLLGTAEIDILRQVIAGARQNDKPFGIVFRKNGLFGITSRPQKRFLACGITPYSLRDEKGAVFNKQDGFIFPIDPHYWREHFPSKPFEAGNYLFRSGQYYTYWGPNFDEKTKKNCDELVLLPTEEIMPDSLLKVMNWSRLTKRDALTMISRDEYLKILNQENIPYELQDNAVVLKTPEKGTTRVVSRFDEMQNFTGFEVDVLPEYFASFIDPKMKKEYERKNTVIHLTYDPQSNALKIDEGNPFPLDGELRVEQGINSTPEIMARLIMINFLTGSFFIVRRFQKK